jgi:hypothetical protein
VTRGRLRGVNLEGGFPEHSAIADQGFTVTDLHTFGTSNVDYDHLLVANLTFKSGVCLETSDGTLPGPVAYGILHGFLAPDR